MPKIEEREKKKIEKVGRKKLSRSIYKASITSCKKGKREMSFKGNLMKKQGRKNLNHSIIKGNIPLGEERKVGRKVGA